MNGMNGGRGGGHGKGIDGCSREGVDQRQNWHKKEQTKKLFVGRNNEFDCCKRHKSPPFAPPLFAITMAFDGAEQFNKGKKGGLLLEMPSFPMHFLISILLAPRGAYSAHCLFSSSPYSHLFIVQHKSLCPLNHISHFSPPISSSTDLWAKLPSRGLCSSHFLPSFLPSTSSLSKPNPPSILLSFQRFTQKKKIFYSIHKNMAKPNPSKCPHFAINSSSRIFVIFLLFFFLFSSSPAHSRAFHPPSGLTFVRSNGRYWPLMFVYANSLDSSTDSASLASDQLESKSIGELFEEQQPAAAPSKRAIMRLGKRAMMRLGRK